MTASLADEPGEGKLRSGGQGKLAVYLEPDGPAPSGGAVPVATISPEDAWRSAGRPASQYRAAAVMYPPLLPATTR